MHLSHSCIAVSALALAASLTHVLMWRLVFPSERPLPDGSPAIRSFRRGSLAPGYPPWPGAFFCVPGRTLILEVEVLFGPIGRTDSRRQRRRRDVAFGLQMVGIERQHHAGRQMVPPRDHPRRPGRQEFEENRLGAGGAGQRRWVLVFGGSGSRSSRLPLHRSRLGRWQGGGTRRPSRSADLRAALSPACGRTGGSAVGCLTGAVPSAGAPARSNQASPAQRGAACRGAAGRDPLAGRSR